MENQEIQPETIEQEEMQYESINEDDASVLERLAAIEDELKRGNQLFESKLLNDAAKDEIIAKLHKELQGYKDDMLRKILKPVFMDMIMLADNMKSLVSRYEETPETDAVLEKYQKLRKEFLKVGSHIDDFLYNHGVEAYSANAGDDFNPRTQQAKKNTDTGNPDEHKKIVSSLSAGYTWDEQILRKENVQVNIFQNVSL
ncbi:MAG: nucleotide exchange factor GrpE [Bacteroidetes bacterium]|nr:nucleotide exchange factor GrpE [Bacteroidota bacterium]